MIEKLKAKGSFILVIRDIPADEKGGLLIPDIAKLKPQTGKVISVGSLVADKTIKKGETAYFHKTAGFELDIEGDPLFVLREQDVIAGV